MKKIFVTHTTVDFWGTEIWLQIFTQNCRFVVAKLEKKIKSSFSIVQLRMMLQKMVFDKLKLEQLSFSTNIDQF